MKEAGAKRALPLPVSVPSHCELMHPAADKLEEMLATIEFKAPTINVVNNVDVTVETDPNAIKAALVRQLFCPVQWTNTINYLADQGVTTAYEVGPGKVLTGLSKRINKAIEASALNTTDAIAALNN